MGETVEELRQQLDAQLKKTQNLEVVCTSRQYTSVVGAHPMYSNTCAHVIGIDLHNSAPANLQELEDVQATLEEEQWLVDAQKTEIARLTAELEQGREEWAKERYEHTKPGFPRGPNLEAPARRGDLNLLRTFS